MLDSNAVRGKHDAQKRVAALKSTARSILDKPILESRSITPAEAKDYDNVSRKLEAAEDEVMQYNQRIELQEQAKRNVLGQHDRGEVRGEVFGSFGEQLLAIAKAGMPGTQTDPRLHKVAELAASGMAEGVPSDGGFLVESTFANEIFKRAYSVGELARRCKRYPIGPNSNGLKLPYVDETSRVNGSRWGGVQVFRANEADTVTAKKPKLGQIEITLEKLMGIGYATNELLQDSTLLEAFMNDAFSEEIGFTVDDEILNGDGTGKCLGILNSNALVTVSKESGQAADTILLENLVKMWARCWGRSRRNAVWLVNQDVEPQLLQLSQAVGTQGFPVFLPGGGLSESPYSTLFGRPIIPIEQAQTLGDKGDIVLADLTQYLLVDKPMNFATSMHVRFVYDEMAFRIVYRVNGQPAWKAALTPKNGSNTLSPFVTLEAR